MKKEITDAIDLKKLSKPGFELRYEVKVRTPQAPKRMNLYLHTDKTDHSKHSFNTHNSLLREYDLPDNEWHTLSLTTRNFEIDLDGKLYIQFSLMDWGLDQYELEVDYLKVDLVKTNEIQPDLGIPLQYRPELPDLAAMQQLPVKQDVLISSAIPWLNHRLWSVQENGKTTRVLTINPSQIALLDFEFQNFRGRESDGMGVLEITVQNIQKLDTAIYEFGMIRVSEILRNKSWQEEFITFETFLEGKNLDQAINSQMIIDKDLDKNPGEKIYATISKPVMDRLLSGKSGGLAIRALGAVSFTFYDQETGKGAKLYYQLK